VWRASCIGVLMPNRTDTLRRLAAFLIVASAAYAEGAERFVGKWQAEHKGHQYLVMTIAAGEPVKLSMTTAVIKIDGTGEIHEILGPVQHNEELVEAKLENGRLLFKTRQDSGDEIRYEMRIQEDGTALLRLADEPDWVKPFRLKRT
jgi:hypothetical protein